MALQVTAGDDGVKIEEVWRTGNFKDKLRDAGVLRGLPLWLQRGFPELRVAKER